MTVPDAIRCTVAGRSLSEQQAAGVAEAIMDGQATPAQIAALLVALRMKGETLEEILGFAWSMRRRATPVPLAPCDELLDTCGTGGDAAGTFNISTVAAFVAAGAGCKVAKHGNRSNSSRCGSSDVLEALGVNTQMSPEQTARCIERIGVGFLFAPQYHPGARHAAGPRAEIGVRTIFNAIGPLVHPAGARRQLVGIYDAKLTEPIAEVLGRLGALHGLVVHGEDGLDEITITGATCVSELRDGNVKNYTLRPEDFGVPRGRPEDLRGGEPQDNARIAREVLSGRPGPPREVVLLNAGAAIFVGGKAASIAEGVARAREAIDSGRAMAKLEALLAASREQT